MSETTDCPICFEKIEDTITNCVSTECGHRFHCSCFVLLFQNRCYDEIKCPICRIELLPSKADDSSDSSSESSVDTHDVLSSRMPPEVRASIQQLRSIIKTGSIEAFMATYQPNLHGKCDFNGTPMLKVLFNRGKIDFIEHVIQMDYSSEESCIATQFNGQNPLFWAMRYPKIVKSIIEIFKKRGFDIDTKDLDNDTGLTAACNYFKSLQWKRTGIESKIPKNATDDQISLMRHKAKSSDSTEAMFQLMESTSELFKTLKEHYGVDDDSDVDDNDNNDNNEHENSNINNNSDKEEKEDTNQNTVDVNSDSDEDENNRQYNDNWDDDDDEEEYFSFCDNITELSTLEEVYNAELEVFETVKILIENGANVNVNEDTEDGVPPLSEACGGNFLDVIKFLIDKGADVNHLDDQDMTPLMKASSENSEDIVRFLLSLKNINIELADSEGCTALWKAVCAGNVNIAKILLDAGANVDVYTSGYNRYYLYEHPDQSWTNSEKHTLLMKAMETGNCEMVKLLIEKGADATVQMKIGGKKTDYLWSPVVRGHVDMVRILLENNIGNVNKKSGTGRGRMTPLMSAVSCHNLNMVKLLLSHGARTDQRSGNGENLIDILHLKRNSGHCLDSENEEEIYKLISK